MYLIESYKKKYWNKIVYIRKWSRIEENSSLKSNSNNEREIFWFRE